MSNEDTDRVSQFLQLTQRIEQALSCSQAADLLGLRGKGNKRFCPCCQNLNGGGTPTLRLWPAQFACSHCTAEGDALELIQLARRCTLEEAVEWAWRQLRIRDDQAPPAAPTPAQPDEIYRAFLAACRPVPRYILDLLSQWQITAEVVECHSVRYHSNDYPSLLMHLSERFGHASCAQAGLIEESNQAQPSDSGPEGLQPIVGSFDRYCHSRIPYLIIPYLQENRVVYLRARPLVDGNKLAQATLPAHLGTATTPPCFYNEQAAAQDGSTLLLFHSELDVLVAASLGLAAVGCPSWSRLDASAVARLAGKQVFVVLDERSVDRPMRCVTRAFETAELPPPQLLPLAPGQSVASLLRERFEVRPAASRGDHGRDEGSTTRELREIELGPDEVIRIDHLQQAGQAMVRCSHWRRSPQGAWLRRPGKGLLLPRAQLDQVISALRAAADNDADERGRPTAST